MQLSSTITTHQQTTSSSSVVVNTRSVPIPPYETSFNNHNVLSDSSSTTTSPNSTPSNTSSSNSSTAPNSPINNSQETSENLVVTVQARPITTREKRNSLTALISTGNGPNISNNASSNRHSAEILSVPELENADAQPVVTQNKEVRRPERGHHRSKSGHHNPHQTHIQPYVALYPYKPQKPDELELKKGCK